MLTSDFKVFLEMCLTLWSMINSRYLWRQADPEEEIVRLIEWSSAAYLLYFWASSALLVLPHVIMLL
jgi:hypothetical protein